MPEPAWYPANNVLVGVAQVREVEFIANNPGDWILHCHMFHHMMNSMTSPAGPLIRQYSTPEQMRVKGYPQVMLGMEMPDMKGMQMPGMKMPGMDMKDMANKKEASPKNSDGLHDHEKMQHDGHAGMSDDQSGGDYGMKGMARVEGRREAMGMRPGWSMGVEGLSTVVRVLPPDLFDRIMVADPHEGMNMDNMNMKEMKKDDMKMKDMKMDGDKQK